MKKCVSFLKEHTIFVIAFILFEFMMIFNITHSAPWGDEWVEYVYSQAGIRDGGLYNNIIITFQPPLYNFLMHFWLKINQSVLWFRLFNIFIGTGTGIFIFNSVKKLFNEKVAGFSLCALAVCYQWVYCIQECSEYALMLCCLSMALYFYVISFEKFTYRYMILFLTGSILSAYSQYGSVFVILPLLFLFYVYVP